jgi:hypothetical protein
MNTDNTDRKGWLGKHERGHGTMFAWMVVLLADNA